MKNISFYTIQKRFVECFLSTVILSFGLLLFLFYLIKNKIIENKNIFKKTYIKGYNEFYIFNTGFLLFRNIPLFYLILKGKFSLIGLEDNEGLPSESIGICTLWFIRKNSKMSNLSISQCNEEYLKNKSFLYDVKILIKSLISLIYYKKTTHYSSKIKLLDIEFNNFTVNQILERIKASVDSNLKKSIFFINADCLNKSENDSNYKQILQNADYILPDGSGINIACNIIHNPLKENLNGTDLFPDICSLAQENSYKLYFLGAKEGIANKMKDELLKKYDSLKIVGTHNGYMEDTEIYSVIKEINQSKADILLIALGAPQQEIFIQKYTNKINAKLFIGVGGLFDFYSNKTKRAPLFIREIGFEWIYRMIQEPKRMWKRYVLGNPIFLYRVHKYKKSLYKNTLIDSYLNTYDNHLMDFKCKNIVWNYKLHCSSFFKRVMDILISGTMLILLFPLFCIVVIAIRVESKGKVLFSQNRVGLNAKEFKMYKFRSMYFDAEKRKEELLKKNESQDGVIFKIKNDPRVTKAGKFIRKTSIDELPQLFNVLKGEMSLVGPRPPLPNEVALYSIEDRKRLDIKPGITCIWQVSGRSNIPFKQQVIMDKTYIKEHGILYDIILLFKTIPAVLFSKGSY